jgi:hypothetical protein
MASALTGRGHLRISFELVSAWQTPPSEIAPDGLTAAEQAVFNWLTNHSADILAAENQWQVDRRAIAGAIAWEGLENVNYVTSILIGCGRSSGPGKVHYKANRLFGEGRPIAKQVEERGYLAPRTVRSRRRVLRAPEGAITYIAAIMCAYADIADRCGFAGLRFRDDLILVQPYQGVRLVDRLDELESWRTALERHRRRGTNLAPDNPMYHWVNEPRNLRFLEAAVGRCHRCCGSR